LPPSKLHQALVVANRDAGRGYYRLVLKAPLAAKAARPGQFIMLRVSDSMDPVLARPFGISAVLPRGAIELYYRVVGRGTSILTNVAAGQLLSFHGPLGNGFPMPEKGVTPVFVAGGSGFPPLLYLSRALRRRSHLFCGARNRACLLSDGIMLQFRKNGAQTHIATEDGSAGKRGRVTDLLSDLLFQHITDKKSIIYACGPRPMLATVAHFAFERSVPCYVSMEERMACGLGVCMGCSVGVAGGGYRRVCKEGPVFNAREIEWKEHVVVPVNNVRRET
jgi:dihydroorotate dehydrogenase electron transfer subunit